MAKVLKPHVINAKAQKPLPSLTRARIALWQLMPKNSASGQGHCAPVFKDDGFSPYSADNNNNCYTYAVNAPNWGRAAFVTPGETGGTFPRNASQINPNDLHQRLLADGLIPANIRNNKPRTGFFLIAAFCAPGFDYHFLRRGADKKWSHKDGKKIPARIKFRSRLVLNFCLYEFVGFYWVPNCGLKLDHSGGKYIDPRLVEQNKSRQGR